MKVQIILDNGSEDHFYLRDDEFRKIKHEVEQQNKFNRDHSISVNYTMVDALILGLMEYMKGLPDPAKKAETPADGAAGESKVTNK